VTRLTLATANGRVLQSGDPQLRKACWAGFILLALGLTRNQLRYGFEGVAVAGNVVYVASSANGYPPDSVNLVRSPKFDGWRASDDGI
jgi:hypothetical protein